ncbi:nucleic acid/nucleotide deaminase domain-containing protein [Streptomyces sp. PKU-EA00015]|uniref:nucleic acid/nucleotide deaminase domain-containing protein n=1 Tax=Streptomyces sp. PKU-EA00015 TaxID=2748326 RepID=UPI002810DCE8|nr:nucleic acid/nucleotide deaminase domain-containing protein [Streptomyces sp. PKU-EA00015]
MNESIDPANPVVEHFGVDGLRRYSTASLAGVVLPDEDARAELASTGVPVVVGPYFRVASRDEPVELGSYAARHGQPAPPRQMEHWLRLGDDRGAELCVRPDGAIQAVVLSEVIPDMYVSSSVALLNRSLLALDRAVPRIAAADGMEQAAVVFAELNAELRALDPAAFAERENWWPRVLDDVRHTLNFPFHAAFEFRMDDGRQEIVTDATGPGRAHPEERIWQRLSASGIRPEQVTRVYCELEPCLMPGHYCAVWMRTALPNAEFTHSFDYGETAESREAGFKELIVEAARRAQEGQ